MSFLLILLRVLLIYSHGWIWLKASNVVLISEVDGNQSDAFNDPSALVIYWSIVETDDNDRAGVIIFRCGLIYVLNISKLVNICIPFPFSLQRAFWMLFTFSLSISIWGLITPLLLMITPKYLYSFTSSMFPISLGVMAYPPLFYWIYINLVFCLLMSIPISWHY